MGLGLLDALLVLNIFILNLGVGPVGTEHSLSISLYLIRILDLILLIELGNSKPSEETHLSDTRD
jgi:hypothetical protein